MTVDNACAIDTAVDEGMVVSKVIDADAREDATCIADVCE
jgi:hypothetical protein